MKTGVAALAALTMAGGVFAALPAEQVLPLAIGGHASDGRYRYCPSVLVEDGVRHVFYCRNKDANQVVDHIYHATMDAAGNLSGETVALAPADATGAAWDSYHVCDPSVIAGAFHYGGRVYRYLMAYLGVRGKAGDGSSDGARCVNNKVGLAVSDSLSGGWTRMGADAVVVSGMAGTWGVGQPSVVGVDGKGKVALFYAGDYGGRVKELDFTDDAATAASLVQFTGDKGRFVGNAAVTYLDGGAPATITNGDFAWDPRTRSMYLIVDTPDSASAWYDGAGVGLCVTKAVSVYRAPMAAVSEANLGNARWELVRRVQPADLDAATLASSFRCHNAGFVRQGAGDLFLNDCCVTVANVGKRFDTTLYSYRFVPVAFGVVPPSAALSGERAVAGTDWIGSSVTAAYAVSDWGSYAGGAVEAALSYTVGGEARQVVGAVDAARGTVAFDVADMAPGSFAEATIDLWLRTAEGGRTPLTTGMVTMLQGNWAWLLPEGWNWFDEAVLAVDSSGGYVDFDPGVGSGEGRKAVVEFSVAYDSPSDEGEPPPAGTQGGLRLMPDGADGYRFQVYVAADGAGAWREASVVGLAPRLDVKYDFRVETDYAESAVTYFVKTGNVWAVLHRGDRADLSARQLNGLAFSGRGEVEGLRGKREEWGVDARLVEDASGAKFATVADAVAAGTAGQPLTLLWDASWTPTDACRLAVVNGERLHVDLSALGDGYETAYEDGVVIVRKAGGGIDDVRAARFVALTPVAGSDAAKVAYELAVEFRDAAGEPVTPPLPELQSRLAGLVKATRDLTDWADGASLLTPEIGSIRVEDGLVWFTVELPRSTSRAFMRIGE